MTYVIVQNCCNDASCVDVCPVDCIHPTPDEADFHTAEMLYINPADCIDCGACIDACPVEAIKADYGLPDQLHDYLAVNEDYFSWMAPPPAAVGGPKRAKLQVQAEPVRVAVVGAGPSGWYVAEELADSDRAEVEVTVFDRLGVSHGLVRHGVAPDHQHTKLVGSAFDRTATHRCVSLRLGVEVGTDVTHQDLLAHHHAVVYCTGASVGRQLGVEGEDLAGVITSADFVHWYNGHPDHVGADVRLDGRRVVVVGNGNVALDIARVLLLAPADLAATDIADPALTALRDSSIEEVVVLGRRGTEHAAFTSPELRSLLSINNLEVVVDGEVSDVDEADDTSAGYARALKLRLLKEAAERPAGNGATKKLVLRFNTTPLEVVGDDRRARGLRVRATDGNGRDEILESGLIVTAIGYASTGVDGVPFDRDRGRFTQDGGRVLDDDGVSVPGVYAAGWVKRGPTGVIGTNRICAAETSAALLDDAVAGVLATPSGSAGALDDLLRARGVEPIDAGGWRQIADAEVARGRAANRPRVKFTGSEEIRAVLARDLDDELASERCL